jgi:hypothetical protein
MKWTAVLFRGVLGGIAGLGFYAFFNAISFFWSATGPLLDMELRQEYFLKSGAGFAGFLICVVSLIWLLSRGRDAMDRFLTDEEEAE